MVTVLDGRAVALSIETDLAARVARLNAGSLPPVLATILVGSDPASATYVRMKAAACRRIGLEPRPIHLSEDTTTEQLLTVIDMLNADTRVCGILLQHPVPAHIDERACFDRISLDKDVDGVTSLGFGRMALGEPAYVAATPSGIMRLLAAYGIPIDGRHAVVIGRSPILGKPMAALLLEANATVTICHSRTQNLPDIARTADITVAAVGKPRFVKAEWTRKDAVVIDAGYHPGGIGDVDLDQVAPLTSAYTPVPGGVGPMTIASLMAQSVAAAEARQSHGQ